MMERTQVGISGLPAAAVSGNRLWDGGGLTHSQPLHQFLRESGLIEASMLEGLFCMDQKVAATKVKVSDVAAGSNFDSVTREPTSETVFGDSSKDDGPEEIGGDSCENDGPEDVALADSSLDHRSEEIVLGDSSEDDSPEQVFYSLSELQDPKLWKCKPDIAERPHEREQFLAPDIFEVVFGMAKDDFTKLPVWRQSDLKKQNQLF